MVITFAKHSPPVFDPTVGYPTLTAAVEAIAAGRSWTWRNATKTERPGYIAADLGATPPVVEVIPADDWYALDLAWSPTAEEQTALDAAFAAWDPIGVHLATHKSRLKLATDYECQRRISTGFSHGGRQYSLSSNARDALGSVYRRRNSVTFPYLVATLDNSEVIEIANLAALEAFVGVADDTGQEHLRACRLAKLAIGAAADVAAASAAYAAYLASAP